MRSHTVTVAFDDEVTSLDAIVAALGKAGYTVPKNERLDANQPAGSPAADPQR